MFPFLLFFFLGTLINTSPVGTGNKRSGKALPHTDQGPEQGNARHTRRWMPQSECGTAHLSAVGRRNKRGRGSLGFGIGSDRDYTLHEKTPVPVASRKAG